MRKLLPVPLTAALLFVALAMPASSSVSVRVKDDFFSPSRVTVSRGTTVVWRWAGHHPHNVVNRGFHSRTMTRGTYSHRFSRGGTYSIVCTIHGFRMTVRVR